MCGLLSVLCLVDTLALLLLYPLAGVHSTFYVWVMFEVGNYAGQHAGLVLWIHNISDSQYVQATHNLRGFEFRDGDGSAGRYRRRYVLMAMNTTPFSS